MGHASRRVATVEAGVSVHRDVALVVLGHALGCMLVLGLGFDHVSDDDFARVTIAQAFAHAPRLDPSGTSWLPFPFWTLGALLAVVGRSLTAARASSIVMASLALALPYLAMRAVSASRKAALAAVAFAALSPWPLWLGAATVPESFTASFTTAAAIVLGAAPPRGRDPGARPRWYASPYLFAGGLLAACLSRYETWPVAATLAVVLVLRAARSPAAAPSARRAQVTLAAMAAAGPTLWMAWNIRAHGGDPLHFFHRVATFKRAIGEGSTDTMSALLLYPRLLVETRPDVVGAAVMALSMLGSAGVDRETRDVLVARWRLPLLCAAAQLAFIAYGNARDGAPAHHAERALLGVVMLLAAFAADVLTLAVTSASRGRARTAARATVAIGVVASIGNSWIASRDVPGNGNADRRAAQVEAGRALRQGGAERLVITPCAFEHFAVIAAYGAPERVEIRARTGAPLSAACPAVSHE